MGVRGWGARRKRSLHGRPTVRRWRAEGGGRTVRRPGGAVHLDGPQVGFGDVAGDREAEPDASPVAAAGRVQPGEPLEDPFPVGVGDAVPVVGDDQLAVLTVPAHLDQHRAPGMALRVVQEVGEEPVDLRVDDVRPDSGGEPKSYGDVVPAPRDRGAGQLTQVRADERVRWVRTDLRQHQQVANDLLKPVDVSQRVSQQLAQVRLLGVQPGLFQESPEPGERGEQLVRGVRHESPLLDQRPVDPVPGALHPLQQVAGRQDETNDLIRPWKPVEPAAQIVGVR